MTIGLRSETELLPWVVICLLSVFPSPAQIVTDGTVGPPTSLMGPDYRIDAGLGRQMGGNLFHSFTSFNVLQGESANFSGPTEVRNILARVTGGKSSNIDGMLSSSIPGANLFLLNPAGIVFGPNAQLDVTGSFTASTASSIRLGVDGRFDAADPAASALTVSPPSAFGFAQANPGTIRIDGSQLQVGSTGPESPPIAGLELSLVGGDIQMQNGASLRSSGEMTLVSVRSAAGDVLLSPSLSEFSEGGDINMSASSARASGPGKTHIRAGNLSLDNSEIGRDVDLSQTGGAGGRLDVGLKGVLTLQNAGRLNNASGGEIHVEANQILMQEGSNQDGDNEISSDGFQGNSGDVSIRTGMLSIEGNGNIGTSSFLGNAGNIDIQASEVRISGPEGEREQGSPPGIQTAAFAGRAGDITLRVNSLELNAAALSSFASSSGAGGTSPGTQVPPPATGGNINVAADNFIFLGPGSSITTGGGIGAAAGSIRLSAGSFIVADSANFGIAGGGPTANLSMKAPVVLINASALGAAAVPPGGKITINACFLSLQNTSLAASAGFFPEDVCTPPIWPGNWPNGAPDSWPNSQPQDWPASDLSLYLSDIWERPPLARACGVKFDLNSFIVRGRGGVALDPAGWQPSVTLSPPPAN